MSIPQLTYPTFQSPALAGMLADNGPQDIATYVAAVDFAAGLVLELDVNGKVQPPITGSANKIAGIGIYLSTLPPGGYRAGDVVPVLRKGRAWVQGLGAATATSGDALKLYVNAGQGGKLTTDTLSAGVVIASPAVAYRLQSFAIDATLVCAEINLP